MLTSMKGRNIPEVCHFRSFAATTFEEKYEENRNNCETVDNLIHISLNINSLYNMETAEAYIKISFEDNFHKFFPGMLSHRYGNKNSGLVLFCGVLGKVISYAIFEC